MREIWQEDSFVAEMPDAAIIADDLSGAADCAAAFAISGLTAFVAIDERPPPADARVVALDTDSRALSEEAAAARVESAARGVIGARILYKKIDSTLRGHVGAEIAAILRAASAQGTKALALVAPAFPAQGRIVREGRVLLDRSRQPEGESQGDLPALLRARGLTVSTASVRALRAGTIDEGVDGVDAVVCDSETEDDLRRVAELGARLPHRVVWVGSGGLARHLPDSLGLRGGTRGAFEPRPGPVLFLLGSRSECSREQERILCAEPGTARFELEPDKLLEEDRGGMRARVADGARRALLEERDVVLSLAHRPPLGPAAAAALASALGGLAAQLADQVGGLVATGGDIARALVSSLGAHGLQLVGEVEPGVPLGILDAKNSLPLVTKAGAFGSPTTLSRCRAALKEKRA